MKKYSKYKDSGIEWIGNIPKHWSVSKLSYVSDIYGGATPKSNIDNYWEGEVNWVTPDDLGKLQGNIIKSTRRTLTEEGLSSCSASIVPKGSIILSSRAPIGHLGILEIEACTNQGCKSFIPKYNLHNYYLYYYLLSAKTDLQRLGTGSTFTEISTSTIKNYRICLPPFAEQQTIASFLDHKTAQIDTLIEKKEQLVEKLTLKRQAIINEAVTKGLNPDVPMKDSGIEWLGEIPEHWDTFKLKHIANLKSGDFISALEISETGEYPVLGGNGLRGFTNKFNLEGTYVLIGRQGALCGNINYSDSRFWATEHAVVCHPLTDIDTYYLGELLRSMNLNQYSESAAQPGLSVGKISNLVIPKIPLQEQIEIANFLKYKSSIIDKSILIIIESINKLKLYRQSLISEAVTGKIDLRDWEQTDNK